MKKLFMVLTLVMLTGCVMNQEQCVKDLEPLPTTPVEGLDMH